MCVVPHCPSEDTVAQRGCPGPHSLGLYKYQNQRTQVFVASEQLWPVCSRLGYLRSDCSMLPLLSFFPPHRAQHNIFARSMGIQIHSILSYRSGMCTPISKRQIEVYQNYTVWIQCSHFPNSRFKPICPDAR